MDRQEELVRLLALQIRVELGSQAAAIRGLHRAGFRPSRIADLLGTSVGTVGVTLAKSKKRGARQSAVTEEE